jgi:hypothetical protein
LGGVGGPARMGRAAGRSDLLLHRLTILATAPALLLCSATRAAGFCKELEPPPRVVPPCSRRRLTARCIKGRGSARGGEGERRRE